MALETASRRENEDACGSCAESSKKTISTLAADLIGAVSARLEMPEVVRSPAGLVGKAASVPYESSNRGGVAL